MKEYLSMLFTECFQKVLEASPGHLKALYRRGKTHMSAGDFEEARSDFKKRITIDKSSEPDATSALKNLKTYFPDRCQRITIDKSSEPDATSALKNLNQKEQEVEMKDCLTRSMGKLLMLELI
ncbi:hypothetical protein MKW92_053801 [Papaver armeniacum]|nr:hypothetical protein MKW92_053801 [Papaver armeniacum]